MPDWRLTFPIDSLDARINMRSAVAQLQADPHHVRTVLVERQERQWVYRVEFEGEPTDSRTLQIQSSYERPSLVTDPPYSYQPNSNGDHIDPEVRDRILREYLANPPRRAPRHSFGPPLRRNIDYQAVGRRTFLVETLPPGTLPVIDRDPDLDAAPRRAFSRLGEVMADITRENLERQGVEQLASPINQIPETREGWVGTIQEAIQGARRLIETQDIRPSPPIIMSPQAWADIVGRGEISDLRPQPPFELPSWVQPGVWVRGKGDPELVACIVSIAEDLQVTIRNWRRDPEQISLPASVLVRHWGACPQPKEPTHRLDRISDDAFLEDLAPKMATVSINGKPSFRLKLVQMAQTFKRIFTMGGVFPYLRDSPEVETRFERLDRDE